MGADAPCCPPSQEAACEALDAAVKIALLSALRTLSQCARYWAWSGRGSAEIRRSAQSIAEPNSATDSGEFTELSEMTGLKTFITSFAGHIAAEAAR
jgi:hypothetical protein